MAVYRIAILQVLYSKDHIPVRDGRDTKIIIEINVPEGGSPEELAEMKIQKYNLKFAKNPRYYYYQRKFLSVIDKADGSGIDRYGKFYSLTGKEARRKCFWCGTDIGGGSRYCTREHQALYLKYFWWPHARDWCRSRYWNLNAVSYFCGDCNSLINLSKSAVHHIKRLPNSDPMTRQWNILNRPENLILLCTTCHGIRHRKPVTLPKKQLNFNFLREDQ